MRKLSLRFRPEASAQIQAGLAHWATLIASPLLDAAQQQLAVTNARFVVSLAQQHGGWGRSQSELLDAAYQIFVRQSQRLAPQQAERFLSHELRQAMLLAIEAAD